MSAEATVSRNYLDWLLDIPWKKMKKVNKNLTTAEKILEVDHYGLEKVKERIIEHLAVLEASKSDQIIPVDKDGVIDLDYLEILLKKNTKLTQVMILIKFGSGQLVTQRFSGSQFGILQK